MQNNEKTEPYDMRYSARNLTRGFCQYEAGVSTRSGRSVDRDCYVSTSEMLIVLWRHKCEHDSDRGGWEMCTLVWA